MARTQYLSNVLVNAVGDDTNYTIDEVTVTIASGMASGAVLELSGGKYIWTVAANVANAVAVLCDERAEVDGGLTAGDHTLKVIARSATVGREYLTYSGAVTSGNKTTAEAALLAVGIKAVDQV